VKYYGLIPSASPFTAPPQNVFLDTVSSTSLWFSWQPPVLNQSDGVLLSYRMSCPTTTSSATIPEDRPLSFIYYQYQLNTLKPFTNYTCCIAAETTNGLSSYSCDTNKTLQDGECM